MTSNVQCTTAEETGSSTFWTPEQQVKELTKRLEVAGSERNFTPSLKPAPDDVIVAVPPKNGTTWMIHVCHQIRMRGTEPDFDHQSDVVTMIELPKHLYKTDPSKPQPAKPHIFPTHLPFTFIPLGGRRLYCFRDQKDVVISAYHYFDSFLSLKRRVSLQVFSNVWITILEGHIKDLLIWWEHRHDDDLLLLFFDDLKEDHEGCVRRIASHINVDCNEEDISRIVHTTTHAEMVKHHYKFELKKHASFIAEKVGETLLPEGEYGSRVRKGGGKSGEGHHLPLEVQHRIDQIWKEIVTEKLGFQDLNEMRKAWNKELKTKTHKA